MMIIIPGDLLSISYFSSKTQIYKICSLNSNTLQNHGLYTGDINSTNIDVGFYRTATEATNVPDGITYANFVQFHGYNGQLIFNATQMFFREFTGSPASWKPWRKVVTGISSDITITAASNVTIDVNKSIIENNTAYFFIKGHASANIQGTQLFTFNLGSGNSLNVSGFTFMLGIGDIWDITAAGYGYMGSNAVTGRVASGKYFHIVLSVPLA